jgi:hypothetical protein
MEPNNRIVLIDDLPNREDRSPFNVGARPPSPFPSLGSWARGLSKSSTVVKGIVSGGALIGMVLFVGGTAVALRLAFAAEFKGGKRGLPVEAGLAVISRTSILVIGIHDAVIAALLALAILYAASRSTWVWIGVVALLGAVVPLTLAGMLWPASLVLLGIAVRTVPRGKQTYPLLSRVALALALALGLVLARYSDPPTRFGIANVWTSSADLPNRIMSCPQKPDQTSTMLQCVDGLVVGTDSDNLYLGRTGAIYEIIAIPHSRIEEIRIFDQRSTTPAVPRTSIIGRLWKNQGGFSATPLAVFWGHAQLWGRELG